jgi:hypothetical protein
MFSLQTANRITAQLRAGSSPETRLKRALFWGRLGFHENISDGKNWLTHCSHESQGNGTAKEKGTSLLEHAAWWRRALPSLARDKCRPILNCEILGSEGTAL